MSVATLVSVPDVSGRNVSVSVAVWFDCIGPKSHIAMPLLTTHVPSDEIAETNCGPTGIRFVKMTLGATPGPRFVTVTVITTFEPTRGVAGAMADSRPTFPNCSNAKALLLP